MTILCVSKLNVIGSNIALLPRQFQAIIWPNAEVLLIRTLGAYFNEIHMFSFKIMHLQ